MYLNEEKEMLRKEIEECLLKEYPHLGLRWLRRLKRHELRELKQALIQVEEDLVRF